MVLPLKMLTLFRPANYRFSTLEGGGHRLSSLYFEAGGIQGRWRREHREGPLLAYQGQSVRWFVDADRWGEMNADRGDVTLYWRQLRSGLNLAGFSAVPVDDWHVLELVPPAAGSLAVTINHMSSGTVVVNDPTAAHAAFDFNTYQPFGPGSVLNAHTAHHFDWTAQPGWGHLR